MSDLICTNPFTGKEIARYSMDSLDACKSYVANLQEMQSTWQDVAIEKRIELVSSAFSYFEENIDQIAVDISEQMGRPVQQAKGEIGGLLQRARYLSSIAKETLNEDVFTDQAGFTRKIQHVPLGVIFVISAWNYPLLITINSVVPALIAGNTVLLKHSSITPKIGEHFEKAFANLGEYKGLVKNIIVDHKTTGDIIEKLPIHHVVFTGSVKGGEQILTHTAKKFMMPGLELGGKDGAYVHNDANLEQAVETLVDGAMFNSGQSCCGVERVYVHADLFEDFVTKAKELISTYKLGDPADAQTNMGPLATKKAADYMLEQMEDAKSKGAEILVGGNKKQIEAGTFFEPTLLTNVDHSMLVMQEENFGPIMPVMKVASMEEAISFVNDSDYGLTSAIFTQDESVAEDFSKKAQTGTVFMNRCDYLDPALPWTGVKNSGCGSSLSKYGFFHVTRRKSIHFKTKI